MKFKQSMIALAIASTGLLASTASATEVSANVTLATDYVFRGISQTDEKGAIQGGFDAEFDGGFYAGVWASNVNFDTDASTEMDYYFGYVFDLGDGVELDLGYIYFDYEGDSEFDYQEVKAAVSFSDWTIGVNYSNEYLGDGGEDFIYPFVDYGFETDGGYNWSFHVGLNESGDDNFVDVNDSSYIDWSVGVSKTFGGVDLSLMYTDTDIDGVDAADGRVVFSISKSF